MFLHILELRVKNNKKQVRKNRFGNVVSNLWKNFRNCLDNCLEKSSSVLIQNTMGGGDILSQHEKLPCFTYLPLLKKKNADLYLKLEITFVYSTNAAKPHTFGDKDLNNLFSFVALRRDNVKTRYSSQTLFVEDLSWEIVFSCNRAIMS